MAVIENTFVNFGVQLALVVLVVLMIPCSYRVWVGPTPADRLQALELLFTLLIALIALLAIVQGAAIYMDLAIALGAFSFIGTLAIARYILEGKIF